jgi:outer membrane lipoprotein-sorting protein
MLKKTLLLTVLLALAVLPGFAQAQTVDSALAKMIDAMGGKKALEAVKDTTTVVTLEMPSMNITGTATMYHKEPNKQRMDMEIMGMKVTQAFDGQTAWASNPQTQKKEPLTEKQAAFAKREALSGYEAILNPGKYGITYALKSDATVDGRKCIVIEQTFADGAKVTEYVDAATYLTFKSVSTSLNQADVETEQESYLGDYRKVGKLTLPHSITVKQGGQVYIKVKVQEITFNGGLEDSFFKMD